MLREYVFGFDCRVMKQIFDEPLWNIETELGKDKRFGKRISASHDIWHSIFMRYPYDFDENSLYKLDIPDDLRYLITGEHNWTDMEAMRRFHDAHFQYPDIERWMVALTVVDIFYEQQKSYPSWEAAKKALDIPMFVPSAVDEPTVNPAWTLLGYDVQTGSPDIYDGLGCISNEPTFMTELTQCWGIHLNEHQLFPDQTTALAFADYTTALIPDLSRFFAYGVYKITAYP
jgi:hypothetical protein